jgi:Ubiquitin carboxyl-terminal hydrolase
MHLDPCVHALHPLIWAVPVQVATVSHHGKNPNAGHYTADVKQHDGRWLRFDDATVTSVPLSMVRRSTHPPDNRRPPCLPVGLLPARARRCTGVCAFGRSAVPVLRTQKFACKSDEAYASAAAQVLNDQAYLLFYSKVR